MATHAIILAAGQSSRMMMSARKVLLKIAHQTALEQVIDRFRDSQLISQIVIVVHLNDKDFIQGMYKQDKVIKVVAGGNTRQDSTERGFEALSNTTPDDVVVVHNAANPNLSLRALSEVIQQARECGAAAAAQICRDAVSLVENELFVDCGDLSFVSRQTPQAARYHILQKAFAHAQSTGIQRRDEVGLLTEIGLSVKMVPCPDENFKLTYPPDLPLMNMLMTSHRVSFGTDSHWFLPRDNPKPLVLCGVKVSGSGGFEANSDGDVFVHALINALAQSISYPSLGELVKSWGLDHETNSMVFLKKMSECLCKEGFGIVHLGFMYECPFPSIASTRAQLIESLAHSLEIDQKCIALIATTGEKITEFGKGNAAMCSCVAQVARMR